MEKEAFEPTGLIPRSIIRTGQRFVQQLLPGKEKIALQEYRVSRYQILVSIKSLLMLILIPLLLNFTIKVLLFTPLIEHFWNSHQAEIFLNQYQEKRAFSEMHNFSEKMFFESLCTPSTNRSLYGVRFVQESMIPLHASPSNPTSLPPSGTSDMGTIQPLDTLQTNRFVLNNADADAPEGGKEGSKEGGTSTENAKYETLFQIKSLELAKSYNKQSILAITNLLGDFFSFFTLSLLFRVMRPELIILKSFLTESVYSLSDTTKSFLLILGMDLLVGFHSPRGWELALEGFLRHIGLPENENFILLFVALFPVFLDTVFKYWIFRYLNKISPSTVVTYHSMIE